MKRTFAVAAATLGAVLAMGCSLPVRKEMSRDEWLTVTRHTFPGVTKDQAIAAAERVLKLADGDDVRVVHHEDGFVASRSWSMYLVLGVQFGVDTWDVRVSQEGADSKVRLGVASQGQMLAPMPTAKGDASVGTMPGMGGAAVEGTAIYDLFWSRMAYLLGQRDRWMSCAESDARVKAGTVWGMNEPLCNSFNVKDQVPEGPMVVKAAGTHGQQLGDTP